MLYQIHFFAEMSLDPENEPEVLEEEPPRETNDQESPTDGSKNLVVPPTV